MKAKLKANTDGLFTPEFHTAINGISTRISRSELIQNWPKYIFTSASSVYENLTELREKYKSSKGAGSVSDIKPVILDMKKANSRGLSFSQPTQKAKTSKAIEAFHVNQKRNIGRLVARNKAQAEREKELTKKGKEAGARKEKRAEKERVEAAGKQK